MDRMLGEVVRVEEVEPKQLVWLDKAYRAVYKVEALEGGRTKITTVDAYVEVFDEGDEVIRGWRFLVARRTD